MYRSSTVKCALKEEMGKFRAFISQKENVRGGFERWGNEKQQVKDTKKSDGTRTVKETAWHWPCTHTRLSQQNLETCLAVCTPPLLCAVLSSGQTHVLLYVQRCGKPNVLWMRVCECVCVLREVHRSK